MPSSTMREMAEDYGYQLAFLKSDPELYRVFKRAVDGGWDGTRFVAAVRGTRWYKTTTETGRKAQQLRYSDPATYKNQRQQALASVNQQVRQIGANLGTRGQERLAGFIVDRGWTAEQVQRYIANYVGKGSAEVTGQAAQTVQQLKQTAWQNGVKLSDKWFEDRARRVALGQVTIEEFQQTIRDTYAARLAPAFKTQLAAGEDLADLASPYMQTMAQTLELNPADVTLFDDTVRQALQPDEAGDAKPLWAFERDLKKDPRWMQTTNAREQVDKVARTLGQTFGVGV